MYMGSQYPPNYSSDQVHPIAPQMAGYLSTMAANSHFVYQSIPPPNVFVSPLAFSPYLVPSEAFWNSTNTAPPQQIQNFTPTSSSPIDVVNTSSSMIRPTGTDSEASTTTPVTRKRKHRSRRSHAKRSKSMWAHESSPEVIEFARAAEVSPISEQASPEMLAERPRKKLVLGTLGKRRFILRLMAP